MNGRVDNNGARSRRGTIVLFVFLSLFPKHRTIIAKNLLARALNFLDGETTNRTTWTEELTARTLKKKGKRIKKEEKNTSNNISFPKKN